jgi:YdjC-like protein
LSIPNPLLFLSLSSPFIISVTLLYTHNLSHRKLPLYAQVFDIFVEECIRAQVSTIRIPYQPDLLSELGGRVDSFEGITTTCSSAAPCGWIEEPRRSFLAQVSRDSAAALQRLSTYGEKAPLATAAFIGLELMGEDLKLSRLLDSLEAAFQRGLTCEWMCHPGYMTPHGCGDEFSCSSAREHELQVLCEPSLRRSLREKGIALGWFDDITV